MVRCLGTGRPKADPELLRLQKTLYTSSNPTRRWLHCTRRDWIMAELRRRRAKDREKRWRLVSVRRLPSIVAELYGEAVASRFAGGLSRIRQLAGFDAPLTCASWLTILPSLNLRDDQFDLILCSEVIEHIDEWQKALAEMYRLTRPGGTLLLSTPQPWSPLEVMGKIAFKPGIISLVRAVYGEEILETGHISLLSEKQIITQLKAAGFSIKERFKSGIYLPLVAEFCGNPRLRFEQWLESRPPRWASRSASYGFSSTSHRSSWSTARLWARSPRSASESLR